MKYINQTIKQSFMLLCMFLAVLASSCEDDADETTPRDNVEVGEIDATSDKTTIQAGESIKFIDMSTQVKTRAWTFPGGDPNTSTDSVVTVTYASGGTFNAVLDITFLDNANAQEIIEITVEGGEEEPKLTVTGATYAVYTEEDLITQGEAVPAADFKFTESNHWLIRDYIADPFEGNEAVEFILDPDYSGSQSSWAMGILQTGGDAVDLSAFASGYLNMAIKSSSDGNINVRLRNNIAGGNYMLLLTAEGEEYGFKRDGNWHFISIPIEDIMEGISLAERETFLATFTEFLILRSDDSENVTLAEPDYTFYLDNVFYSVNKPAYE